MARVSGRNVTAAWVVGLLCAAIVVTIVVVSVPVWEDLAAMIAAWWSTVAPFQGG